MSGSWITAGMQKYPILMKKKLKTYDVPQFPHVHTRKQNKPWK